jgi:hypothetical protein
VKQVALSGHSGAYSYGHGHQKDDDEEGWMVARLDGKALEEDVSDPKKRKNDHPAYERERQSIEQDSELVELAAREVDLSCDAGLMLEIGERYGDTALTSAGERFGDPSLVALELPQSGSRVTSRAV